MFLMQHKNVILACLIFALGFFVGYDLAVPDKPQNTEPMFKESHQRSAKYKNKKIMIDKNIKLDNKKWVLIKSDTIPSRIETMYKVGMTKKEIAGRIRNSSSVAQSTISNYFVRGKGIKKVSSYN